MCSDGYTSSLYQIDRIQVLIRIIILQSYAKLPVHSSSPRCRQWVPAHLNTVPSSIFYWIPNGESLNFWLQMVYSFLVDICKAALTKAFPQKSVNRKWKHELYKCNMTPSSQDNNPSKMSLALCLCMYVIMRWCAHTMMWLKMESVELHKYKAKMIFFLKKWNQL